jgi:hypothetical protein
MVEHSAVNRTVVGSSPTPGATFNLEHFVWQLQQKKTGASRADLVVLCNTNEVFSSD